MLIDENERGMLLRLREVQLLENDLRQIGDNIEQHEVDGTS